MDQQTIQKVIGFIRDLYAQPTGTIPLHAPVFNGKEKAYLERCVDTTFVSSVGEYVDRFESDMATYTGSLKAVAVVNGTNAIQVALRLAGVESGHEVITQPLTFAATCNAIKYLGADPVFVDVDRDTMGMSPESLDHFLKKHGDKRPGGTFNKTTGRRISAVMPMHTFGHPVRIPELLELCRKWNIPLVEDAAESIGSKVGDRHTGTFGLMGVMSFNGNKIITTGGGGMILTDDEELGKKAKHLTTTAKVPHRWDFFHDELGYNFRMPNINAALGCAQLEMIDGKLASKRLVTQAYKAFFSTLNDMTFFDERPGITSNFWLNALILNNREERDSFLAATNDAGIQTRPIWILMYRLPLYKECFRIDTPNAEWLEERTVNIPSSVRV